MVCNTIAQTWGDAATHLKTLSAQKRHNEDNNLPSNFNLDISGAKIRRALYKFFFFFLRRADTGYSEAPQRRRARFLPGEDAITRELLLVGEQCEAHDHPRSRRRGRRSSVLRPHTH